MATRTTARKPTVGRSRNEPDLSTFEGRFAARLRQLRDRKKWLVDDVCNALAERGHDIQPSTVFGWEGGRRQPKLTLLPVLAEIYGVSIRSLLPPE